VHREQCQRQHRRRLDDPHEAGIDGRLTPSPRKASTTQDATSGRSRWAACIAVHTDRASESQITPSSARPGSRARRRMPRTPRSSSRADRVAGARSHPTRWNIVSISTRHIPAPGRSSRARESRPVQGQEDRVGPAASRPAPVPGAAARHDQPERQTIQRPLHHHRGYGGPEPRAVPGGHGDPDHLSGAEGQEGHCPCSR